MSNFKKVFVFVLNYLLLVNGQSLHLVPGAELPNEVQSTADPLDYVNPVDIAGPTDLQEAGVATEAIDISVPDNNLGAVNAAGTDITIDPLESFAEGIENIPQDFLVSWQARRSLRRILAQMPCGWPEYNVPPLAPYVNENFTFETQNQFVKSHTNFQSMRIDGLNNMEINRLTMGVVFKRISFDFNFPSINISGNFNTSIGIDWKEFSDMSLRLKGNGKFAFGLENLRVWGSLKYKFPILIGSAKVHKLETHVSLGNMRSELSGSINGIPIQEKLNELIVTNVLKYFNEHDYIWNGLLERRLLPAINTQLEGKTLLKVLLWSLSRSADSCAPGTLSNMDMEELHQLLLKGTSKAVQ